ncbi:MAG: hypothetical protein RPU34_03750 [Candidatus Sedimenticola sp. (ex Thyasira tokunagai)]
MQSWQNGGGFSLNAEVRIDPFPLWSFDLKEAQKHLDLAGMGDQAQSYWAQITGRVFERRKP